MPRRLPAVYDPINGKLYGEDPIVGLLEVATGGGGGGGSVTIAANVTDVLSSSGSTITADSATADKIVFWDQSASKLTYLEVGPGLNTIGTTLSADIQGNITLTVDANIGDIFSATSTGYNATFTADSAGSDKIVFWDHNICTLFPCFWNCSSCSTRCCACRCRSTRCCACSCRCIFWNSCCRCCRSVKRFYMFYFSFWNCSSRCSCCCCSCCIFVG